MVIDWTRIILAVIALLSAVITGFLVPYLKQKMTNEQMANIEKWLKIFCSDAEIIFERGPEKKAWVLEQMNKIGIKISAEQLDAYLEAVVKELKAVGVI